MNSLVVHVDGSQIKINSEQYYLHNISDGKPTLQYVTKHRSITIMEQLRYLNTVIEFTNHSWAKEFKELLLDMKKTKGDLIEKGKEKYLIANLMNLKISI